MTTPNAANAVREASAIWIWSWMAWVSRCFLWIICWLTVILGPPATFALFYAAHYNIHGADLTLRELAASLREYWWQSWVWMLANLAIGGLAWGIISVGRGAILARWAVALVVLFWLAIQFNALPIFMLQDRKQIWRAWRSGAQLIFSAPFFSLATFGAALVVGTVSLFLVAPLAMGGPGLVAVLAAQATFERGRIPALDEEY